ncbi:MAG: sugar ABC transporter permease [Oscillospiraceae bacterium]|nr:sugar ABC transporter permease [Oscillospiraceae bacterium]
MIRRKGVWITLFILPCMVLFAFVYAAPIVTVAATSLTRYTAFEKPAFTGFANFKTIFGDKDFLISVKNTVVWVLLQTTLHVSVGLVMALMLHRKPKGWKFTRTVYLIPNIIPTAATGIMFTLLLNPTFGVIKDLFAFLGVSGPVPNLLGNSKYAFWAVTATWIFYSAFNTVIFLAELSAVNKDIYEAAAIDGATPSQVDRHINLPILKNAVGTCVILASVAMVSQFDIIYMTTRGGPGTSTLNLPVYLYKAMLLENNYGKANAVGVVQIILGVSLVLAIRRLFRSGDGRKTALN